VRSSFTQINRFDPTHFSAKTSIPIRRGDKEKQMQLKLQQCKGEMKLRGGVSVNKPQTCVEYSAPQQKQAGQIIGEWL